MGKKKVADKSLLGKKPINRAKLSATTSGSGGATAGGAKYGLRSNPSHIGNKLKRSEMYGKYLQQKSKLKREQRVQRVKDAEALGQPVEKHTPHTIDNQREVDITIVAPDDDEVMADEADDEFAPYFGGGGTSEEEDLGTDTTTSMGGAGVVVVPKVLVTTRPRPSQNLFYFIADLQQLIPGLQFYPRQHFSIKEICQFASNRNFTHIMVLSEKAKVCNGLTISHLGVKPPSVRASAGSPLDESSQQATDNSTSTSTSDNESSNNNHALVGPTAFFKVMNVVTAKKIPNHGASTSHIPELNVHGFTTRLGHRVGRLLASLFPVQSPEFQGRQVVTFHNQRDYIFVRHHRYKFRSTATQDAKSSSSPSSSSKKKSTTPPPLDTTTAPTAVSPAASKLNVQTKLQELGPRFTLKLRWVQDGIFDTAAGEYEFIHKRKQMDTSRRKFHL